MKVLFAGSPSIAVPSLKALCSTEGIELVGVLTCPDTPKGRHGTLYPTDVGEAAEKQGITPILKPAKLDALAREQVSALKPDLLISFAFGRIFGPKFLALFPLGGINVHPSLLPKYRGPSPVQAVIQHRDTVTGVTLQMLAEEMDCGDILAQEQLQLTHKETAATLSETVAQKAAEMLPEMLKKFAKASFAGGAAVIRTVQNHSEASYCSLISRDDGIINWTQSVLDIEAKIRAFNSWPLCRTIHDGRELIILKAEIYKDDSLSVQTPEILQQAEKEKFPGMVLGVDKQHGILIQTGDGILVVTELQYQAKKALFWRDFLNGARDFCGSQLG